MSTPWSLFIIICIFGRSTCIQLLGASAFSVHDVLFEGSTYFIDVCGVYTKAGGNNMVFQWGLGGMDMEMVS